jgi:hypothetical protein
MHAARKPDLIDPEHVANGVTVAMQDQRGHGLLLFQFLYLAGELLHLLLNIVPLRIALLEIDWLRSGEIANHQDRTHEQEHSQDNFDQPLPCGADRLFGDRRIVFGHDDVAGRSEERNLVPYLRASILRPASPSSYGTEDDVRVEPIKRLA